MIGNQREYASWAGLGKRTISNAVQNGLLDGAFVFIENKIRPKLDFQKADELWKAYRNRPNKHNKKSCRLEIRACDFCGQAFSMKPGKNKKYCSLLCSHHVMSNSCQLELRTCLTCGKRFSQRSGGGKYCSDACSPFKRVQPDGKLRCYSCGGKFLIDDFFKDKSQKHGVKSRCKKCDNASSSEYSKNHKDYHAIHTKKWQRKNADKLYKIRRAEIDNLDDAYIRRLLARYSHLSESQFPQWLVDLKRSEIRLLRVLRARGIPTRLAQNLKQKGVANETQRKNDCQRGRGVTG
jgi:hypothetical protein